MPAFWLNTEEGRKAFDKYRFAFIDDAERHMRENLAKRKRAEAKFRWDMLHAQIVEHNLEFDFDSLMNEIERKVDKLVQNVAVGFFDDEDDYEFEDRY